MLINELLYLFLFVSRERVHSCFACFEVVIEVYCMISHLSNWHPFGLYFPKHFQPPIELFRHHFLHLFMIFLYFFLSSLVFLFIYCLSNNLPFIFSHFFLLFYLNCFSTQRWTSRHSNFSFLPIYLWIMGH